MIRGTVTWTEGQIRLNRHTLVGVLLGLYVFALAMVGLTQWLPPIITTPPIVLGLTLVPGALCLLILEDVTAIDAKWVVYSVGISLMTLVLIGLIINIILPQLGIGRPLSVVPVAAAVSLVVGLLGATALAVRDDDKLSIVADSPLSPTPLAFAHLPLLSAFGVILINVSGDNRLLIAVLAAIAFLPMVVYLFVKTKWHSFGIWTMALAVLYHDVLLVGKTFPGNPVVVRIWRAARWKPGLEESGPLATELLQHGTIFPMFAHLTDLNIITQMKLVNPVFVSFIPVALFIAYRNYVDSNLAFLGASLFIFAHPFYNQYPTAGRSATPVIFLALFALVLSDSNFSRKVRTTLALLFVSGVVFTHYGTSYFFMVAIGGAILLLLIMELVDRVLTSDTTDGRILKISSGSVSVTAKTWKLLSLSLVAFYSVLTFAWYLYTNDSRAFGLFPRHLTNALQELTGESEVGRTGARLQREYGGAIEFSKYVYVLLAVLISIGILVMFIHRFSRSQEYEVDDTFLALGSTMLGLFGTTLIIRTWGGGRPMMITFVFTLLFAVIGVSWLSDRFSSKSETVQHTVKSPSLDRRYVTICFTLVLAALFVLNSGVATALFLSGSSPSSVPMSDGETNLETDMSTHAWVIDHYQSGNVYGDHIAFGHTDWTASEIALRTESARNYGPERPRNELGPLTTSGAGEGYLLLLAHNLENREFNRYTEDQPISIVRIGYMQHQIYTTGKSEVYYFDD